MNGRTNGKPRGKTVVEAGEAEEVLPTAELDLDRADEVRQRMRLLQDRRPEVCAPG